MPLSFYFYLALITALDICAILLARYYTENRRNNIRLLSLLFFALSGYVYVRMLGFAVTAVINIIYVAFSVVFVTLTCHFRFKEKITFGQLVGMVAVLIGVFLL